MKNVVQLSSNILLRDIKWHGFFCFNSIGDLCAAKYVDDQWYRAKVEKLSGNDANILYVDYGNRATIPKSKCASLPGAFTGLPPYAKEYTLALCSLAQDVCHLVDLAHLHQHHLNLHLFVYFMHFSSS